MNKALSRNIFENSLPLWQGRQNLLLDRFNQYFAARTADTPHLLERAHALRYQVYCLERKFESPDNHVSGLEMDEFDSHAKHGLLIHRPTDEAIGTVRLILPIETRPEESFPVQHLLLGTRENAINQLPLGETAEVSRFAISKQFRRRYFDELQAAGLSEATSDSQMIRRDNLPCLGLIQILLRQSVEHGVKYWAAVMEPKMLRMLASLGIDFCPVGGLVVHHGLRQPCYCDVPKMLNNVLEHFPEYWDVITNGGELAF